MTISKVAERSFERCRIEIRVYGAVNFTRESILTVLWHSSSFCHRCSAFVKFVVFFNNFFSVLVSNSDAICAKFVE